MVGFKANAIRSVPPAALPVQLRWLILTDNELEALPDDIGGCHALQKLMLSGNRLRCLPPTLAACKRLELLRIAANELQVFPQFLLTMPRLCWLAFAGNPFCETIEQRHQAALALSDIDLAALEVGQLIGEGASGHIFSARHKAGEEVGGGALAIKMFKGEMTSDGLPQCEMAAALRAGRHAGLPVIRGRLRDPAGGANGLVMDLISPTYQALAGPPSFETCTRDVYPPSARFEMAPVLAIAGQIASVAHHLHGLGIAHGDLYAHNVLVDSRGQALMGDFGAASFYEADGGDMAVALQRLEVRAFGLLLDELLARCQSDANDSDRWERLIDLVKCCVDEDVTLRPLFNEALVRLSTIS